MSNTPTDAEIRGLAAEGNGVYQDDETAVWEITDPSLIKFARAVLAKWGTPQPTTAEFALQALVAAGHVSQELVDKALALPGAPQPVVREPLTANQVSGLAESAGYWHGDMSRADFINGIRYAEAAHGIKQGGQHGTE